jgi:hypothetical protein
MAGLGRNPIAKWAPPRHGNTAKLERRWRLSRSSSDGEDTEIHDAAKNTHLMKVLA